MIDAEKYNLDIHRHIEKISKKKPIVKSNRFVPKHKDDKLHILYQKQKWFYSHANCNNSVRLVFRSLEYYNEFEYFNAFGQNKYDISSIFLVFGVLNPETIMSCQT